MRRSLVLCIALAAACGSSSPNGTPSDSATTHDGSAVTTHDAAGSGSGSAKMDAGVYDFGCDDSSPCSTSQVCCTQPNQTPPFACESPTSCPAADQITCDGPDECAATPATPMCCGVEVPDGNGSFPSCGITSISTTCVAATACPTNIATNCTATTKVTICHVKGDCMDSNYPDCCTFTSGASSLTFCVNSSLATFGTCHQ